MQLYAPVGRSSIAPVKLLRALLLHVLYTVRSERLVMEPLDYNLLFLWFVGLNIDGGVWNPTVFYSGIGASLEGDIAQRCFEQVLSQAWEKGHLSDQHFTVDGTSLRPH